MNTIRVPIALYQEIQLALDDARRFKYRGKIKRDSYDLATVLSTYYNKGTKDLAVIGTSDQPETCINCGKHVEMLYSASTSEGHCWCPNCGNTYMLEDF